VAAYSATFTGAASTDLSAYTSDSSHTHTKRSGGGALILNGSGDLTGAAIADSSHYTASYTPPSADYEVQAVYLVNSTLSWILDFGGRGEIDEDGIYIRFDGFTDQWQLYRNEAGSDSNIDNVAATTGTHTLKLAFTGSTVEWFLNGASQGSHSVGTLTAAGLVAYRNYNGTSTAGDQVRIQSVTVTETGSSADNTTKPSLPGSFDPELNSRMWF
jgi:hypothetical protein